MISQSGRAIAIEAWSTERADRWRAESSPDARSEPLRSAIASLADQMRESFGHYKELQDKYEAERRYGEAIYFSGRINDDDRGTRLGFLYFDAGLLGEAESEFGELKENENELLRSEAIRGLALVRSARGEHSKALGDLRKARKGAQAPAAKLLAATLVSYRGKFRIARKILESLAPEIEGNVVRVLKAERSAFAEEALRSKFGNLTEEDQDKLYVDLDNLAEVYGSLGRCAEALGDAKEAEENYRKAVGVLRQRASLWIPYHRQAHDRQDPIRDRTKGPVDMMASNLGVRLEDLARYEATAYDEAIRDNERRIQDASEYYRENPEDASALMNIAWATAGNVSCFVKKLNLSTAELGEARQQVVADAEQLVGLLQANRIPMERWRAVVSEASDQQKRHGEQGGASVRPIKPLNGEQAEELVRLVTRLLEVIDLPQSLDLMSWIVDLARTDDSAQSYFSQLAQQGSNANAAEAYFGLACVHAVRRRYDNALLCLWIAIQTSPDLKNRARLDEDLRSLRSDERYGREFAAIVRWNWIRTTELAQAA